MICCLDFDGVLCDSIDECFVVGYNACYRRDIDVPAQAPSDLHRYFVRHRYLVGPAEDFFLLFHAFESGAAELDRASYAQLQASTTQERAEFGKKFFAQRSRQKENTAQWLALHRMYEESRAVLQDDFPAFYVVTTKDRESVELLAAYHGYRHKLKGIYSKEVSTDKRVSLQRLFDENGVDPAKQRVVFVDDNRHHLEQVESLGIETCLAGWGYADPLPEREFRVIRSLDEIVRDAAAR